MINQFVNFLLHYMYNVHTFIFLHTRWSENIARFERKEKFLNSPLLTIGKILVPNFEIKMASRHFKNIIQRLYKHPYQISLNTNRKKCVYLVRMDGIKGGMKGKIKIK